MSGIVGKNAGRSSGSVGTVAAAALADDSVDSDNYVDGSIDNAHIADDAIDSEHYADGSIDNAHIADDAIDSEHYVDGSIDNAHLADDAVGVAELSATGTASSSTFLRGDNSWAAAGGGKLLQAVSTVVTANPSTTTGTWVDISGFAVTTGTLASSSSKLLILVQMAAGTTTTYNHNALIKITPSGGSAVYPYKGAGAAETGDKWNSSFMGDISSASAVATGMATGVFLYSAGSTAACTIQIMWRVQGGQTVILNMAQTDTYGRTASSVTVLEIGA